MKFFLSHSLSSRFFFLLAALSVSIKMYVFYDISKCWNIACDNAFFPFGKSIFSERADNKVIHVAAIRGYRSV